MPDAPRPVTEHLRRHYLKEEEFLDEFGGVGAVAAKHLQGAWIPDDDCDDAVRKSRRYFLATGELAQLVFDSAAVYHNGGAFSSVQVALRSATRTVTVRVRRVGENLIAETIVDRTNALSEDQHRREAERAGRG